MTEEERFARQVRRAKQLIARTVLAALACLAVGCGALAVQNTRLSGEIRAQQAQLAQAQRQAEEARGALAAQPAATPSPTPYAGQAAGEYQAQYPELYVQAQAPAQPAEKTVYLTFDDGPSGNTQALLDILDKYGAKATFFVVGTQLPGRESLLAQMVGRGHAVGVHSYSHQYSQIYDSVDAFLQDMQQVSDAVQQACGQKPALLRFPGGSINGYSRPIYQALIAEVCRRGYSYFDWNVSAEDAVNISRTRQQIAAAVVQGVQGHDFSVVLLHDSDRRETTVRAVEDILEELTQQGYRFEALDGTVPAITFAYEA